MLALPALVLSLSSSSCDKQGKPDAKAKAETKGETSKKIAIEVTKEGGKKADGKKADDKKAAGKKPTPADAKVFATAVDAKLRELWTKSAEAEWHKATDITDENEKLAAAANAEVMKYETQVIGEATSYDGVAADPDVRRQIDLLKLTSTLPAPNDDAKRKELAEISASLEGMYGKGKWCADDAKPDTCQDLGALSGVLAEEAAKHGDAAKQLAAWEHWRTVSVPMRGKYQRFVELGNEGAKAIGFANVGEVWRSRYDMTPQAFEQEMERLWGQVKPLYDALHCHVRASLNDKYGDAVPVDGLIPAHLSGNMWSQDWANLYPWLEPYPGEPSLDVTKALVKAGYDELKMVKAGESFFTSLGLNSLPETFWERSLFKKPADRDVVCHASAWDVGMNNDLRIKMCIKI
ncbi:MAG: M2 family metallopeptidase, partial [Deltaproteobacteria bacterium]|nr:M2 family metallopeptidase [Deltaproteobacteria bacterium]